MRFLLHVIMIIPELSLVITLTRRDIVNADRLAHVILLDWVKQEFSLTASMGYLKLTCGWLAWEVSALETHHENLHMDN